MRLHTASEVISLARKLENETADFYDQLGLQGNHADLFRSLAAENRRNVSQVEWAYYGVISDALESGFAFDIESGDYELPSGYRADAAEPASLRVALEAEARLVRLYTFAAGQSDSLLADVPRVFRQIAQKRTARIGKLESLLAD